MKTQRILTENLLGGGSAAGTATPLRGFGPPAPRCPRGTWLLFGHHTSCQNRCESAARKRQLKELARKAKEKREQEAEPAAAAPGATREGRRQRIQPPSKADAQQPRARRPHEQQITCASVWGWHWATGRASFVFNALLFMQQASRAGKQDFVFFNAMPFA